jgi:putative two-component system hydrogenase maturation factor HypX/HoxX
MRIMLLTSAHNGLSQRVMVELQDLGHDLVVEVVAPGLDIDACVREHDPELVVCPFLTARIPEATWRDYRCLIVHPGIVGDRGPSSLDWAIVGGEQRWGVTILQAAEDFDAGDIWASEEFALRPARKSSVYRHEVTEAAVRGVLQAVDRAGDAAFAPVPLDERDPRVRGCVRPPMRRQDREIDWSAATTSEVLARVRAADGRPGVADELLGRPVRLFGAHAEGGLRGEAGALLARRDGAVCRATVDGAVWITHLCAVKETGCPDIKLPATAVLGAAVDGLPLSAPSLSRPGHPTWQELAYDEDDGVGYLSFDFNNGAVGTDQARRLLAAVGHALARPTRVLVLLGGVDFFCNGIHLGLAEAAEDPGRESLENLIALNAVAHAILTATDKLTVSALRGDAAAGGVMVALAADAVLARTGVMLNPHYNTMGLYGSEYWTYVLPRRVGVERAALIARECRPMVAHQAVRERLIDSAEGRTLELFGAHVARQARALADDPLYQHRLEHKRRRRAADEARRPLADHQAAELERMERCFLPPEAYYHLARRCFFAGTPAPPRPPAGPFAVDAAELGSAGRRLEASVA